LGLGILQNELTALQVISRRHSIRLYFERGS